jgi:serine/threonine protein kinase
MSPSPEDLTETARRRIGQVLRQRWQLDSLVGVGGMAAVYAATHRNGRRAAIKVLHEELAQYAVVRERFQREGYAANRVEHPGAVTVLDDDVTDDGCPYLVMELLQGETLEHRTVRKGGRLEYRDVLSVVDRVLDVLAAAHAKGIVHRDIKPENIFVTADKVVKVLDFGVAAVRELENVQSVRMTAGNAALGSPAFMPPEQARGRWNEIDARSDLWALGATAYVTISGFFVHDAETPQEMMIQAATKQAGSIGKMVPRLSAAICNWVDKSLRFHPGDRFQSASEMQEALRQAYHQAEQPAPKSDAGLRHLPVDWSVSWTGKASPPANASHSHHEPGLPPAPPSDTLTESTEFEIPISVAPSVVEDVPPTLVEDRRALLAEQLAAQGAPSQDAKAPSALSPEQEDAPTLQVEVPRFGTSSGSG